MRATASCLILLIGAGTASAAANRLEPLGHPLRICVIQPGTERLVHDADVWIHVPGQNASTIRYGQTGPTGNPFEAERTGAIDPKHKSLLVTVRKGECRGAMRIVYDAIAGSWAPLYWYVYDDIRGEWQRTQLYRFDEAIGEWVRIIPLSGPELRASPPPMVVMVDKPFTTPVRRIGYSGAAITSAPGLSAPQAGCRSCRGMTVYAP